MHDAQETLVGSNSTGGAIFIDTQKSKLDWIGGYLEDTYGNYDTVALQGAVNLRSPTRSVFARPGNSAVDSYYRDLAPLNRKPGRLNEQVGRLASSAAVTSRC